MTSRSQGAFAFSEPCRNCRGTGSVIDDPCPTCAGSGVTTQTRTITVRIPAGVKDGQRIRLAGKGARDAAAGRRATCSWWFTSPSTRCSGARATT